MDKLKISAVGDISTGLGSLWRHNIVPKSNTNFYSVQSNPENLISKRVKKILRESDITFGNLEGVVSNVNGEDLISNQEMNQMCRQLMCPKETILMLEDAGFDVINLTNNHILDCGEDYVEETIERLKSSELDIIGNPLEEEKPLLKEIEGYRIGFAGFNLTPDGYPDEIEDVFSMAETLSDVSDTAVISLHWGMGNEKALTPSPEQIKTAHRLSDKGADIILGHHSHMFQPVEQYSNGIIAYSLGDFTFYTWDEYWATSGILEITVSDGNNFDLDVTPTVNIEGTVKATHNDRIVNCVPASVDASKSEEEYRKEVTRMKTKYNHDVAKYYLKNIHKQPIDETVSRFKGWGKTYLLTKIKDGKPYSN